MQKLADGFANLPQGVQVTVVALAGIAALLGPIMQGIEAIVVAGPGLLKIGPLANWLIRTVDRKRRPNGPLF